MKKQAYEFCENYILSRLDRIHANIKEINSALNSETKSSAGDKHETGRAMLQLEREKLGKQLFEAEKTKSLLSKVDITKQNSVISLGSLFKTDRYYYFISISAGVFEFRGSKIFCISPQTPIAKQVLGKKVGQAFVINEVKQHIICLL